MPGAVARAARARRRAGRAAPFHGIRYVDGARARRGAVHRAAPGSACGARRCTRRWRRAPLELGVARRARPGHRRAPARRTRSRSTGARARYLVAADGLHSPIRARARARRARAAGAAGALRAAPALRASRRGPTSSRCTGRRDCEVVRDAGRRRPRRRRRARPARHRVRRRARASCPSCARALRGAQPRRPGPRRRSAAAAAAAHGSPAGCCSSATPRGYVDALTGEGLRLAIDEARAAVAAIARRRPRGLRARVARRSPPATGAATGRPARASRPGPRCGAGWCPPPPASPACSRAASTRSPVIDRRLPGPTATLRRNVTPRTTPYPAVDTPSTAS